MARIKYEAVATVRKYKDKETGELRKHYQKCGTVFESETGKLSLKLDTIPIAPGWSGFLSLVPPRPRGEMAHAADEARHDAAGPEDEEVENPEEDETGGRANSNDNNDAADSGSGSNTNRLSNPPAVRPLPRSAFQNGAPPPPHTDGPEDDKPF